MSTRENIHLIARAPLHVMFGFLFSTCTMDKVTDANP